MHRNNFGCENFLGKSWSLCFPTENSFFLYCENNLPHALKLVISIFLAYFFNFNS